MLISYANTDLSTSALKTLEDDTLFLLRNQIQDRIDLLENAEFSVEREMELIDLDSALSNIEHELETRASRQTVSEWRGIRYDPTRPIDCPANDPLWCCLTGLTPEESHQAMRETDDPYLLSLIAQNLVETTRDEVPDPDDREILYVILASDLIGLPSPAWTH